MNKVGSAVFDNLQLIFAVGVAIGMAKKEKEVAALSALIAYFVMNVAVSAMLLINNEITADGQIAADVLEGTITSVCGIQSLQMGVFGGIIVGLGGKKNIVDVDCCATRLRITVAEPEKVRYELLKQTDSRGIVKKGQGVQVIYGPHVTVIKAKLEEYLETAPNEFADETPDNVQVQENAAAGNADGQNSAEVEDKNAGTVQSLVPVKEEKIRKTAIIYSPVDGIAADLSTAPDEGFAGKMMGDGAVVTPTEGTVYALSLIHI